jgi:uncharacterized membrane protein
MILLALLGILLGSYALLTILARFRRFGWLEPGLRGRASLALLFAFTGLGHFVKTDAMAAMLPEWVPLRVPLIHATGVLELAGAVGLLVPGLSRIAGWCLIAFLVAAFPANVHAAVHRVEMGGHESGPIYLAVRGPFQALLVGWAWWFAVRVPEDRRDRFAGPAPPA